MENQMPAPLASVIVPTHNRADYAMSSIRSLLAIDDAALQVVITDTSETSVLKEFAEGIMDSRLVYRHIAEPLSMTENHNMAMSLATGEYVCLIGDDDTVSAEFMQAVRWAYAENIDILSPLIVSNYAWPDFRSRYMGMAHAGRLYVRRSFGSLWRSDSASGLRRALRHAVQGTDYLPKIYHGIVRRALVEQIKSRSGAYFHGSSPDVSGAVALALVAEKYVEVDYPLTIPGASGKSNTGRSALNKHKGSLKDDPHTKRFRDLEWPSLIPRFTSVETVWAQAATVTLRNMSPDLLPHYNYLPLYSACMLRHWGYRSEIFNAISQYRNEFAMGGVTLFLKLGLAFCAHLTVTLWKVFLRILIPTASAGKDYVPNLPDIFSAQQALAKYLNDKGKSLRELLRE